MIYEMLPESWIELQRRLATNHGQAWAYIQQMEYQDAMSWLNQELGTQVTANHSIKQAAEIWLNALYRKEGTIVLIDGRLSK